MENKRKIHRKFNQLKNGEAFHKNKYYHKIDKPLQKKNLIVFDIDGTLTDSVTVHQKAFTEVLLEIGVKKVTEFKKFKHHTDSFISKEIYEIDREKLFSKVKINELESALTQKISCENFKEIEGAKKLIKFIESKTNFAICYATGSLRRPAEYKLKSIGIKFNAKQLVASDNIYEREKIVSKAIENASKFYNVKKFERIISVGDGLWDLLTAKNLGLEFIGVGLKHKELLIENGAKYVYENLTKFKLND